MALKRHKREWEELGSLDPLWAVLTDPDRRLGGWDERAFFETGERVVERLMRDGDRFGYPRRRERALDFGCGVGRLSRALAARFEECHGVDISESMIQRARELNAQVPGLRFTVNDSPDLRFFPNDHFDLVCSYIALQHLPRKAQIRRYLAELVRTLRPEGLLAFQLQSRVPLVIRMWMRQRAYSALRAVGLPERLLYERWGLHPIRYNAMKESDVVNLLRGRGSRVLEVRDDPVPEAWGESRIYYATKAA
jgi:SAM-dependent methyltransferase